MKCEKPRVILKNQQAHKKGLTDSERNEISNFELKEIVTIMVKR
jgi:hypothetical protein